MNSFSEPSQHPRIAFRYRDFRFHILARFLTLCSHQMLVVAISQYIYELTHNPLALGYIGLSLFFPKFSFTLFAGHTADRYDRKKIIFICRLVQCFAAFLLIGLLFFQFNSLWIIYSVLFLIGTSYAFEGPASQTIVTDLVATEHFSNAVTWNSSCMYIAFVLGPAMGGGLYAWGGKAIDVLVVVALIRLVSIWLVSKIKTESRHLEKNRFSLETVFAGLKYVFQKRIILGIISLDLFAVLLGGAVALMPIFANDILKIGAGGLGILRAAPPLGAALMAILLAHLPPFKKAGKTMLIAVAIFGAATIVFGLSKNFYLSLFSLFVLGASDMISVIIRGVLVQTKTPPEMRGRVSAVNSVFIGASNELGEFESGLTARLFGTVPAVVIGGLGTILVVCIWNWRFPEIGKYKRLDS